MNPWTEKAERKNTLFTHHLKLMDCPWLSYCDSSSIFSTLSIVGRLWLRPFVDGLSTSYFTDLCCMCVKNVPFLWSNLPCSLINPTHESNTWRCTPPWPSCFQLPSAQRRSCPAGTAGRRAPRGRCPWFRAPDPSARHGARNVPPWPRWSRRWCAQAANPSLRGRFLRKTKKKKYRFKGELQEHLVINWTLFNLKPKPGARFWGNDILTTSDPKVIRFRPKNVKWSDSCWVNAMLVRNDLPELGTNLVSALASLNVHELAHGCRLFRRQRMRFDARGLRKMKLLATSQEEARNLPKFLVPFKFKK